MSYSLRRLAIVFAVAVVNIAAWTQDTPVRPPSMSVTSGQQSNAALASAEVLFEQGNVGEA